MVAEEKKDSPQKKESTLQKLSKEDVICEWKAPTRIFKKRGKEYFSTLLAFAFLLSVIGFILGEILWILMVWAFAFFLYVLATVEPDKVKNKITEKGIKNGNNFFRWDDLTDFWVEQKNGYSVLHIAMPMRPPGRVILLVEQDEEEEVLEPLADRLVFHEEPPKSWTDRAAEWLSGKFQLETPELAGKEASNP